jgi:hypothetical protein
MTQVATWFLLGVASIELARLGCNAARWFYEHHFDSEFSTVYFHLQATQGVTHEDEWDQATWGRYSEFSKRAAEFEDEIRNPTARRKKDRLKSLEVVALLWLCVVVVGVPIAALVLITGHPEVTPYLTLLIGAFGVPALVWYVILDRRSIQARKQRAITPEARPEPPREPKRLIDAL